MKRKNLFAGLALCSLALGAHAISPDDAQVCVVMKDWSTKNYKISDLKRIVFHESELGIINRSDQVGIFRCAEALVHRGPNWS